MAPGRHRERAARFPVSARRALGLVSLAAVLANATWFLTIPRPGSSVR